MPCAQCGGCCRIAYVFRTSCETAENRAYEEFLEFTRPSTFARFSDGLVVRAVCEHLTDDNTCRVYEKRPRVCRDFLCKKAGGQPHFEGNDTMRLNVLERLMLLGVLPEQGNFLTLKIVRQLREALSFSEEEIKALKIEQKDGRVEWQDDGAEEKDVPVGEKAMDLIVEALKKKDDAKELTDQHFSLYEKFVVNAKPNA